MEQPLKAHKAGTVTGLKAEVGSGVTNGEVICEIKDAEYRPVGARPRAAGIVRGRAARRPDPLSTVARGPQSPRSDLPDDLVALWRDRRCSRILC